jgi:hypothetical protein
MPSNSKFGHKALGISTALGATTVKAKDFGTLMEATGATTFTLPPPSPSIAGVSVWFYSIAAGDMVVTGTAGKIVTYNNAAADSITFGTDTQEIGAGVEMVCDGTSWLAFIALNQSDAAVTVA